MDRFRRTVRPSAENSDELWAWSVQNPGPFWTAVWDYCDVRGPGRPCVEEAEEFWRWRFLPDARLNMAENLLADRHDVGGHAIIAIGEDGTTVPWTWDRLRSDTAVGRAWLGRSGSAGATGWRRGCLMYPRP